MEKMQRYAKISSCGKFRYALWRIFDKKRPIVMFICLNPSIADSKKDDNTVRRCIAFAKKMKCGGLSIGNLFALRSTKPAELWKSSNPVGSQNEKWLKKLKVESKIIVAAWGNKGAYCNRSNEVLKMFPNLYCLGVTKQGQPRHPLYLSMDSKLKRYFGKTNA